MPGGKGPETKITFTNFSVSEIQKTLTLLSYQIGISKLVHCLQRARTHTHTHLKMYTNILDKKFLHVLRSYDYYGSKSCIQFSKKCIFDLKLFHIEDKLTKEGLLGITLRLRVSIQYCKYIVNTYSHKKQEKEHILEWSKTKE